MVALVIALSMYLSPFFGRSRFSMVFISFLFYAQLLAMIHTENIVFSVFLEPFLLLPNILYYARDSFNSPSMKNLCIFLTVLEGWSIYNYND